MRLRDVVIGLDIGTTSVKAVVFTTEGKLILDAEEMITTNHPQQGWAEQDPTKIEQSTILALKRVVAQLNSDEDNLLAIGLSTAMHSIICMDQDKKALSDMIIWSDGRSTPQAEALKQGIGKEIYSKTGTPIHPMTPFLKLMWMRETEFEAYRNAAYFMSMKEYLLWKWFDKRSIDYGMASATGLFNVKARDWETTALEIAGIRREQLSEIIAPDTVLTNLAPDIADEIGIRANLPFVVGSADGQFANLGDGAILPGEVAISVGTSGAIRQFTKGAPVDPESATFTYAFTDELSIIGGPTNNGGIVLQWLKDVIEYKGTHEQLIAGAEAIDPGAGGIIFLPYVNGERAPIWNQRARGNFFGLSIEHKKEHLVRAVLEGIAFNVYHISKSLERLAGEPSRICVNGGLSQSELWVQILANIFGKEVHLSETHHGVAWGAAWTALVGTGKVDSFAAIKDNIPIRKVIQPQLDQHETYAEQYQKYETISKELAKYF